MHMHMHSIRDNVNIKKYKHCIVLLLYTIVSLTNGLNFLNFNYSLEGYD